MSLLSKSHSNHSTTNSDLIIEARHISQIVSTQSESLTILDDVSLEVKQKETLAIIGSSGAGKSTLMTILAGLEKPTKGEINLLQKPIHLLDDEQRAAIRREHIGFVFQSFLLIPTLSALENVTLPYLLRGETEDTKRAKALLESVGLSHRLKHTPNQLSGGEQQRVALARAFITSPKILFADEPTGNLDQITAKHIIEQLFNLNKENDTTLVLVTHDPSIANQCQRRIVMKSGRIESQS